MTELTDNLLQIFCVFICGCCSCISAIRNRSYNRLLVLLFYLSFGMGLAYWVLYLILLGTSPLVFCVSELSWTASYIFLTLRLYADVPKEKHKKKAIFWILPLFSLGMGIFFCLRGSYFENILMGTAMGILGFYAVKGIYFAKIQKQTGKLWIFAAALIFYAAEYLLWGSSYFIAENTFINPYYLVDIFIMNPALILIAVHRAGRKSYAVQYRKYIYMPCGSVFACRTRYKYRQQKKLHFYSSRICLLYYIRLFEYIFFGALRCTGNICCIGNITSYRGNGKTHSSFVWFDCF